MDEVEDRAERAAYAAADVVRQSAQYAVSRQKKKKAQKTDIPEMPVSGNPTQESVYKQLEAPREESNVNKPKDKQLMQDRQRIKARNDAAVKAKEKLTTIKTREAVEIQHTRAVNAKNNTVEISRSKYVQEQLNAISVSEKMPQTSSEPGPQIKSKSEYLKIKTVSENKVYRLKQKRVYRSKDNFIKPKTVEAVRAKQEEKQLNAANDKSKAVKEYAKTKLKNKAQRPEFSGEIPKTEVSTTSNNITSLEKAVSSEQHITPKQKSVPEEQIKVKRADIKTKDSYIRSYYSGRTDIKLKPAAMESPRIISQEKQLIKSKPKNVIRSVSEQTSVKPTYKIRLRKMPKARKTAKRAVSKTQKQVTK